MTRREIDIKINSFFFFVAKVNKKFQWKKIEINQKKNFQINKNIEIEIVMLIQKINRKNKKKTQQMYFLFNHLLFAFDIFIKYRLNKIWRKMNCTCCCTNSRHKEERMRNIHYICTYKIYVNEEKIIEYKSKWNEHS